MEDPFPNLLEVPDGVIHNQNIFNVNESQLGFDWFFHMKSSLRQEWPDIEHCFFALNNGVDNNGWEMSYQHEETSEYVQNVE